MNKNLTANYNKIKKAFPELEVTQCEVFKIGSKVLVTEKFLSDFFQVSGRAIRLWREKGLPLDSITVKKLNLYNLPEVIKWNHENIKRGSRSSIINDKPAIDDDTPLEQMDEEQLDRKLKIEKVKIERVKHKELVGKLIPAEDTDKVLAEIGAVHTAQYRGDLKLLPMLLENKPKHEIALLLDEHYQSRIEDMHKLTLIKGHKQTIFEEVFEKCQKK